MRKSWLRYLPRFLILSAALLCWLHALLLSEDMLQSAGSVSFRYETDGVSGGAATRMLEEEIVPFAAWRQRNNVPIEEREFSRDSTIQVLEVVGDAELVLPVEELQYGFLPVRGSMDTCAINAAAAYALWGGVDVTGEILTCGDKEYTVTGVFSQPENTIILHGMPGEDSVFPHLEVSVSGIATSRQQAEEFRVRYSLPEPDILIDRLETALILRQLTLLPAVLAAALLLWKGLRRVFGKPVSSLERVGFTVAMVAGVLMAAWAIGFSPIIPAAAIPGRWSDFSFWSGFIEGMTDRIRLSRALSWPAPDLLRLQKHQSMLFYSGGALVGFVISMMWNPKNRREEEKWDGIHGAEEHP